MLRDGQLLANRRGGYAVSDQLDLVRALRLPVLLVVGMRLGCVNHARLTAQSLQASGVACLGWIGNHIDPAIVGNDQRILITEMAGRASVELKARELGLDAADDPSTLAKVVEVKGPEDMLSLWDARHKAFHAAIAAGCGNSSANQAKPSAHASKIKDKIRLIITSS